MKDLLVKSNRPYMKRGGKDIELTVTRCFPWSSPNQYLSLKNSDGEEVLFLEDLNGLSEDLRKCIEERLSFTSFAFEICKVNSIQDEFELRKYDVNCIQGHRVFYTKLDEYPKMAQGLVSIIDLDGDIYQINNRGDLDLTSLKKINHLID